MRELIAYYINHFFYKLKFCIFYSRLENVSILYCILKLQLYFLNLSSKVPAGVIVRTSKYPYMEICDIVGQGIVQYKITQYPVVQSYHFLINDYATSFQFQCSAYSYFSRKQEQEQIRGANFCKIGIGIVHESQNLRLENIHEQEYYSSNYNTSEQE